MTDDKQQQEPAPRPRWHFGCHAVRAAESQPRQLIRAARRMRDRRIPCDALIIEGGKTDAAWNPRVIERLDTDLRELRFRPHGLLSGEFEEAIGAATSKRSIHDLRSCLADITRSPLAQVVEVFSEGESSSAENVIRTLEAVMTLPLVSLHYPFGGAAGIEPWNMTQVEESVFVRLLEQRMGWLPFLQAVCHDAENGIPLLETVESADGPAWVMGGVLLVAPVVTPGGKARRVSLPPGRWMHFWSDRCHSGKSEVEIDAPPGRPPMFFKAGAIIPSEPARRHSEEEVPSVTFLDVYADDDMQGVLVDEAVDGGVARTRLHGRMSYGQLTLEIPVSTPARQRMMWCVRLHGLPGPLRGALLNGRPVECGRASLIAELSFRAPGEHAVLDVEFEEY